MLNWGLALFGGFAGAILTVLWQEHGARRRALSLVLADFTHMRDMLEAWMDVRDLPPHDVIGPNVPELRSSSLLGNDIAYLPPAVLENWFAMEALAHRVRQHNDLSRAHLEQVGAAMLPGSYRNPERVKQTRTSYVAEYVDQLDESITRVRTELRPRVWRAAQWAWRRLIASVRRRTRPS